MSMVRVFDLKEFHNALHNFMFSLLDMNLEEGTMELQLYKDLAKAIDAYERQKWPSRSKEIKPCPS